MVKYHVRFLHYHKRTDKQTDRQTDRQTPKQTSAPCVGGLPIESRQPTSVTNVACGECDRPPCCIHAYTVYTPIGGKGRCRTRRDLQDHSMQARKSAAKISTLDLKPMRKDTRSPKQEQSVAAQNGPWSRQKIKKKQKKQKHQNYAFKEFFDERGHVDFW